MDQQRITSQQARKKLNQANILRRCRKLFNLFSSIVVLRMQAPFSQIFIESVQKSQSYQQRKAETFYGKLSKIVFQKRVAHFHTFYFSMQHSTIQKIQSQNYQLRIKDRVYEAKLKGLKTLVNRWEERHNYIEYKDKYFTPKVKQTSKMLKARYSEKVFNSLKSIIKQRLFNHLRVIRASAYGQIRKKKALVLLSFVAANRKHWLLYGFETIKSYALELKHQKNIEQISQLNKKLIPVVDPQIISLKEKQQKLQESLDIVEQEKNKIQQQIDRDLEEINAQLQQKRITIKQLNTEKQSLQRQINILNRKNSEWKFTREDLFCLIYKQFLMNLKLCIQTKQMESQKAVFRGLKKDIVLGWLSNPNIHFNIEFPLVVKAQSEQSSTATATTSTITTSTIAGNQNQFTSHSSYFSPSLLSNHPQLQLVKRYIQLSKSQNPFELLPSSIWSCIQQKKSYQQLATTKKYGYKVLNLVLLDAQSNLSQLLYNIEQKFNDFSSNSN